MARSVAVADCETPPLQPEIVAPLTISNPPFASDRERARVRDSVHLDQSAAIRQSATSFFVHFEAHHTVALMWMEALILLVQMRFRPVCIDDSRRTRKWHKKWHS
jgi:hypothetical protein